MTEVNHTPHLRCPRDVAFDQLRAMLLESSHGTTRPLLLSVKVPWTGIELSKEVDVEYTVPAGSSQSEDAIGVSWTPEPGGIYPSFSGDLRVLRGDHTYSCVLVLAGHYTPPLGVLGASFDAAVGHRVAEATVKYLLEGLASGIQARERTHEWREFMTDHHSSEEREVRVHVIKGTCIVERLMLPPPV